MSTAHPINNQPAAGNVTQKSDTLSLGLLIALVVGSILGSGIFGIPQNMAAGAGAGAILIGWAITGIARSIGTAICKVSGSW